MPISAQRAQLVRLGALRAALLAELEPEITLALEVAAGAQRRL